MKKRVPFTALELVMVITIAAILLSISLPAFYNISSGRRVTGALTAIAANISLARARAISDHVYTAVIFYSSGDRMRVAEVHKTVFMEQDNKIAYSFVKWLDESLWEEIGEGVVIPSGDDNFHELHSGNKKTPYSVTAVNFSEIYGASTSTVSRAIIFSPWGQVITKYGVTDPIVIRVAEGTKVPGSDTYVLKKRVEKDASGNDVEKCLYGILTVNPLSCRTEVDYVSE